MYYAKYHVKILEKQIKSTFQTEEELLHFCKNLIHMKASEVIIGFEGD